MRPSVALAAIALVACAGRNRPRAEHRAPSVCPHDAASVSGVCRCSPGLAVLDGACVGPRELDAYFGPRRATGACAPGDAVDLASGTCVSAQRVRDLLAHVRPVPDDLKLGCQAGRSLAVQGDEVACLPSSDVCPRGSDWDATGARCATVPACEPGEVRAAAGGCVRIVTRERDGAPVVDVGLWVGAILGADGGEGTSRLCRPLAQQPGDLDVGPGGAQALALTIELTFPNNDVTQLSSRVEASPAGSPAASRIVQSALYPLLVPLRALGGISDAASVSLRVRCAVEGGRTPSLVPR